MKIWRSSPARHLTLSLALNFTLGAICSFFLSQPVLADKKPPINGLRYRVFTDGIYDLTHFGHFRAIQKARLAAAAFLETSPEDIHLVVGISGLSEQDRANYKRPPVLTRHEIRNTLQLTQGVNEVIFSPMTTTAEVMEKQLFDLVVAGEDYAPPSCHHRHGLRSVSQNKGLKYYPGPIAAGRFTTFPREPDISTTDLMRRTAQRVAEKIKRDMVKQQGQSDVCIDIFLSLMDQYFPAPQNKSPESTPEPTTL